MNDIERRRRPLRTRWTGILTALGAAVLLAALPVGPAAAAVGGPVLDQDFPDPSIVRAGDTYYAFATQHGSTHIQSATSGDLTHWSVRSQDVLPDVGAWADGNVPLSVWAPDVFDNGHGWTMFYTARDRGSNKQCIGVATAASVDGTYSPASTPLVCTLDQGGSIDPSVFDDGGQRYIVFKNDGNCCSQDTWLQIAPVSADGTQVTGVATKLVKQDRSDEGNLVEAPVLWKHDGTYVLFYSANDYANDRYETSYARASNLFGPYTKAAAPLLTTSALGGSVRGPGGEDVVTGPDGKDEIVFHGWNSGYQYRAMYVADLGWANGYPVVRGAKVRYQAENAALTDARARDAAGASDGRAVGYVDYDDSRIAFTVYAPRAGTYRLSTIYGNGSGAPASHKLWVNGQDAGTVDYADTGWDHWTTTERDVTLTEGWNTITYGKGANWAELDAIDVA